VRLLGNEPDFAGAGRAQVIDHILMVYAQNPSGKYMIPMPHQLQISTVVTCDVIDAVGEFLAAGKKLFQIAEQQSLR